MLKAVNLLRIHRFIMLREVLPNHYGDELLACQITGC